MAQTSCPQCGQTFKNPTGLDWHIEHVHTEGGLRTLVQSQSPEEAEPAWQAVAQQLWGELGELRSEVKTFRESQMALQREIYEQAQRITVQIDAKLVTYVRFHEPFIRESFTAHETYQQLGFLPIVL